MSGVGVLDRYIIRSLLTNFAMLMVCLSLIIIAVDFTLKFDEYIRVARNAETDEIGLARTMFMAVYYCWDLWWPRLLLLFGYLLGPVLIGALGFTCAHMIRHRELVATLAGGLSLSRVARPMLTVAVVLIGAQWLNRELLVPRIAHLLTRNEHEAGNDSLGALRDFSRDGQGRLVYSRKANLDTNTIDGLWVWERDESGLMTRRYHARRAVWRPDAAGDGGVWLLENGRVLSRRPVDMTTGQSRLLAQDAAEIRTDVDPTALRLKRFEGMAGNLSMGQLAQLIDRYRAGAPTPAVERRIDALERIRFARIASLVGAMLTLLICLPFFLRKEPASMVRQSLIVMPIALGAFAANLAGATASIPGLPPQLSVFVPAIVMLPLAIAALTSMRS